MFSLRNCGRPTKTGRSKIIECDLCGGKTIRWEDEKIQCKYCGELV